MSGLPSTNQSQSLFARPRAYDLIWRRILKSHAFIARKHKPDKYCNVKMANEEHKSDVTVDDILQILGSFGRANVQNYVLILFPILLSGIYSSVYNFEALDLPYRCSTECNDPSINFTAPHINGKPARCVRYPLKQLASNTCSPEMFDTSTTVKCSSYVYFEDHSIVKEFNLGCQDWKRSLVGTVHNAGFFVSIPLTGFVSDKYGRRVALVFASVTSGIFGVIRGFAVNYEMFMAAEFLETAIGGGVYTAGFVLALELVRPKGRVFVSLLFDTFYILGGITVTLLYWWLQNWRTLLFVIYTPGILVLSYLWLLTESFRWLFSKGHYIKGVDTLKKCERINKVAIPKYHYEQVQEHAKRQRDAEKSEAKQFNRTSMKQLFMSKMIWKRLMTCAFLWISSTLGYFGLSINAIELAGNSYMNYIIVLLIEAPANICKFFLLDRFGRKRVIVSAFIMSGIILINYGFIPGGKWSMCFYLAGKFFITLAYNSLYIFAAEVFPTNYRTTMLGLCSTIGRIGSVIAPQTPLLAKYYESLPTLFFGAMATISGFLVLTLPETSNRKLPDSLKEAQDLERIKKEGSENKGLMNSEDAASASEN